MELRAGSPRARSGCSARSDAPCRRGRTKPSQSRSVNARRAARSAHCPRARSGNSPRPPRPPRRRRAGCDARAARATHAPAVAAPEDAPAPPKPTPAPPTQATYVAPETRAAEVSEASTSGRLLVGRDGRWPARHRVDLPVCARAGRRRGGRGLDRRTGGGSGPALVAASCSAVRGHRPRGPTSCATPARS